MLSFDLRDALRGLIRDRSYSAVVVLTLALTIGATTAVFAIVNGVLLKPLAFDEPGRLVIVNEVVREFADTYPMLPVNPRHFERWRERSTTFESLAEYNAAPANLTGLGEAAQVETVRTSGTLFEVLRVQPALGRLLNRADEAAESAAASRSSATRCGAIECRAIRRRSGGPSSSTARRIPWSACCQRISKVPTFTQLIGPGRLNAAAEVFVPLRLNLQSISPVGEFNYAVVGRLKAGSTIEAAQAELDVLQAEIARDAADEVKQSIGLRAIVRPLAEAIVGGARRGLMLLLAAIAAVLAVACSNLANLSLTRTLARLRDAAIRTALGATGRRLVGARRPRADAARCRGRGARHRSGGDRAAAVRDDRPDRSAAPRRCRDRFPRAGVRRRGFGHCGPRPWPSYRRGARPAATCRRCCAPAAARRTGGLRIRSVLLTVQVALAVTLLVVTALLTMSFTRLLRSERGFSPEGVVAADVSMPPGRYSDPDKLTAGYDQLLERVQAIPGISSAAWVSVLPLSGENWVDVIQVAGDTRPFTQMPTANFRFIGPDYFRTMGMALKRGRSFTASERSGATLPAIVTERTAAVAWPGLDPIGRRFLRGDPKQTPFEVVGIIADGYNTRIDAASPLMVYVPYWFRSRTTASLVLRGAIDSATAAAEIRRVARAFDAEIAIARVRPVQQLVDTALASHRYQATVFVVFGGVGFLIAMIGVYATTAYGVSRRRREMNIRVALGATRTRRAGARHAAVVDSAAVRGHAGCRRSPRDERRRRQPAVRDERARPAGGRGRRRRWRV